MPYHKHYLVRDTITPLARSKGSSTPHKLSISIASCDRPPEKIAAPWLPSSRSECHALLCRCRPKPTNLDGDQSGFFKHLKGDVFRREEIMQLSIHQGRKERAVCFVTWDHSRSVGIVVQLFAQHEAANARPEYRRRAQGMPPVHTYLSIIYLRSSRWRKPACQTERRLDSMSSRWTPQ